MRLIYKNIKKIIITGCILISSYQGYAQFSDLHYIPPFYAGSKNSGDIGTHFAVLSTTIETPFLVTLTDGTGSQVDTFTISKSTPITYTIGTGFGSLNLIDVPDLNTVLPTEGLIFSASQPFYVNIRHKSSNAAQGGSLTSKGRSGFGTEFRTGHIYSAATTNASANLRRSHFVSVMATENNTNVIFSEFKPGVVFLNTPTSGNPLTTNSISVTLNKGESYVLGQDFPNTTVPNEFHGVKISSDKNITVNTGSWLASANKGGSQDIGIDQIVPTNIVGQEYILVRGEGTDDGETIIVVSTEDNTDIRLNGASSVFKNLAKAGDFAVISGSEYTANLNLLISGSKNVYVYQTTSGGTNDQTVGMNFIPPIKCSVTKEVFIPNVDQIGNAKISVIAKTVGTVSINGVPMTNPKTITGNSDWVAYKSGNVTGNIAVVSDQTINVALLIESGALGASGYFSGFDNFILDTQTIVDSSFSQTNTIKTITPEVTGPYTITAITQPNNGIVTTSSSNATVSFDYVSSFKFNGLDSAEYKVCGVSPCAALGTSCITYKVFFNIQSTKLISYNIFTPNNDNVNDTFSFTQTEGIQVLNVKVYNRWGDLVFETDVSETIKEWDGKSASNSLVAEGTYYYILKYKSEEQNGIFLEEQGYITVLH